MTWVPIIMALLRKCKDIVNTLHFKAEMLEAEVIATNDTMMLAELLDKISDIKVGLDADDRFTIEDNDETEDSDDGSSLDSVSAASKPQLEKVHRLQNEVPIRWNSSLNMIVSLLHLSAEATNVLKQTGHYDTCLKVNEWGILEEACWSSG